MKRFTWNIAPFTYRALDSDADKDIKGKVGIVGRTFETEELYKVVTGSDWYESYDYEGADDGTQFVSKGSQRGDVYKKQTAGLERRDLCCAKFRREYEPAAKRNKNLTSINFPILRYSDVLLMVAEAENEYYGYPTQLAQDCLKEVRERAGVNVDRYIPSLATQSKFREAIKDDVQWNCVLSIHVVLT